ncbi:fructosamine kinase family protein [uncultured Corynebacterium sp.]|uniref:fructosamine kinase family protein n=1 Tax=uncultured Corynebacterium sp. TaxID=159447 RepID=UPI00260C0263|nr:fructosamine kinase family protein [uncultured Corynebacterium sp.]
MPVETFTKTPREPHAAEAEAAGLRWLAEGTLCIAEVISVTETTLVTRRYAPGPATPQAAEEAGRELYAMHSAGASAFGCPPANWEGQNYIGTQPQECTPRDTWLPFYAEQRVLPFVRSAVDNGNLAADGAREVERALDVAAAAPASDVEPKTGPARIHGDLWAGNLLFTTEGPRFIDPAAHGGHPETDLAMLALFGAPQIERIFSTYEEVSGLDQGWEARIPLHQLHPLAVHATTHGPSYGVALVRAARDVISLFG